jgi:hypothetical protein
MNTDIADADAVVSAHAQPQIEISERERMLVKQFCSQNMNLKLSTAQLKDEKKRLADDQKAKRKTLMDAIRERGEGKCFLMPRSVYKEVEEEAAKRGYKATIPTYLRLQKTTTDSNITAEVAESAILDMEKSKFMELVSTKNPAAALIECIVDNARSSIRTSRESIVLSENPEKGLKFMDIPELEPATATEMSSLFLISQETKKLLEREKAATSETKSNIKKLEPNVASFLEKCGRKSQQIRLQGGGLYKISSTKSSRATKITIKMFEQAVSECVAALHIDTSDADNCLKSLEEKKRDLVKKVQLKLNAVPKKTSCKIGFAALHEKPDEKVEIEDEDGAEET